MRRLPGPGWVETGRAPPPRADCKDGSGLRPRPAGEVLCAPGPPGPGCGAEEPHIPLCPRRGGERDARPLGSAGGERDSWFRSPGDAGALGVKNSVGLSQRHDLHGIGQLSAIRSLGSKFWENSPRVCRSGHHAVLEKAKERTSGRQGHHTSPHVETESRSELLLARLFDLGPR